MHCILNQKRPVTFSCMIRKCSIFVLFVCHFHFEKIPVEIVFSNSSFSDISTASAADIFRLVDYMHFLADNLQYSFGNITKNGWDFIRIALSSWVLSASKSSSHWKSPKVCFDQSNPPSSALNKIIDIFHKIK